MKACTNCYYYSSPIHVGDLSCAVNPGGEAEQCSAYEYEDHSAELRDAAVECIKAACAYLRLKDLQERTFRDASTGIRNFKRSYSIYSRVAQAREQAYAEFDRTLSKVQEITHPKKFDVLKMLLRIVD